MGIRGVPWDTVVNIEVAGGSLLLWEISPPFLLLMWSNEKGQIKTGFKRQKGRCNLPQQLQAKCYWPLPSAFPSAGAGARARTGEGAKGDVGEDRYTGNENGRVKYPPQLHAGIPPCRQHPEFVPCSPTYHYATAEDQASWD